MATLSHSSPAGFLAEPRQCGRVAGWDRLGVVALWAGIAGCGQTAPFPMVHVQGKVTYADGTLIPGDRIVLKFNPVELKKSGKASATAGHAEVDPADGSFDGATTWKHMDGVVAGRHKVVVMAFRRLPNGIDEPTSAVPRAYQSPSTTPLEMEISSSTARHLEIQVDKPTNQAKKR